jgi:hypothetical protein
MEQFIDGNKGKGLYVRVSLGSFCFLPNEELIIHVMNSDSKGSDIYIKILKDVEDRNPCCSDLGTIVPVG